jgi:hypothetical protein
LGIQSDVAWLFNAGTKQEEEDSVFHERGMEVLMKAIEAL